MPFDNVKLKKFFGTALKVATILTVVLALLFYIMYYYETRDWNPLNWSLLTYFITFLVLEWIGTLILHGRIQPDAGYPQRRPQQNIPYYPPEPIRAPQTNVPVQITLETCSFCGKEVPKNSLRTFRDDWMNEIYICEEHLE